MTDVYYDDDADLSIVAGRAVAVLGYGSQGHAHALSLRDSGVDVVVGLPEGSKSRAKAEEQGLRVTVPRAAAAGADLIMVLAPDTAQRSLFSEAIAPSLTAGKALFFGHGLNIRYGFITPPADVDVCMVAPKGPGHLVRKLIVDLMYEGGIARMRYSVSDTAEYGDYSRGPRVIDDRVKESMRQILREVQSGEFAREWIAEDDAGRPNFTKWRAEGAAHPIEETGRKLRSMMSWVDRPITETT